MYHVATHAPLLYLSVRRGRFSASLLLLLLLFPSCCSSSTCSSPSSLFIRSLNLKHCANFFFLLSRASNRGGREINLAKEEGKERKILHYWESNNNERHKMNNINRTSKEAAEDFSLKQENHHDKTKKQASSSSSSLTTGQWLRSKDPRIVRVSRAFGGKDRHSKVFTVRGLRDRRVRLSVSTAIQLYDLQDRLGFNQPSKVVDWLLDAAKHEIDELPPLQIPPGSFSFCHHHQPSMNNNEVTTTSQNLHHHHLEASNSIMSKSKEEDVVLPRGNNYHHQHRPSSFLGLLNTMPLGYNVNDNQWEEANNSGINLGFANQHQTDLHSNDNTTTNVVPFSALSSTLSLSTGPIAHDHDQQPYFASHFGAIDMDPRQMNQYHHQIMLSNSSNSLMNPSVVNTSTGQQPTKPFSLSMMMMNPKLLRSPNSSETQPLNKDQVFPSK